MTIKTKNLNGSLVITLGIGAIVSVIAALGIGGLHGLNLLSSASANSESSEAKRFNFVEREEWDNLEPDNGTSKLTIKTPDDPNTSDLQTEGVQNKSQYLTSMTITDLGKTVKFEYITGGVKAVGPMNMDGIVIGGTNQSHATSTIFGGENNSVSVSGSVIVASSGISLADAASNMFVSSKNTSLQGPVNTVFMGVENLHGGMNRANLNQTLLVNVEDSSIDGGNVSNSLFVGTGNFYASNSFVAGNGVDAQKNNIFVFSAKDGFTPSQDSAFYADAQVAINPQMTSNAQLYVNGGMKIGGSNVAFSSHGDESLYGGTIALLNGDAEWMPGSAYVGLCGLDAKADRWVPLSALARDDGRCTREQKVAVPEHGVSLKKTSGTEFSLPSVWNGKVGKVGTHGKIGDREKWQWIYGKSNQRGWFLCQDNYIPDNSQPYGKIGVNCIPCGEGYSSKSGDLNCTCDKIGAGGQCFDDEKLTYNWACENNLSVCKNNLGAVVDNSYCADKTNNLICNVLPKVYQCTGSVPTSNVTKSSLSPLGADRQWTEGDGTTACTFKCNDGYRLHNGNCAKLEDTNTVCPAPVIDKVADDKIYFSNVDTSIVNAIAISQGATLSLPNPSYHGSQISPRELPNKTLTEGYVQLTAYCKSGTATSQPFPYSKIKRCNEVKIDNVSCKYNQIKQKTEWRIDYTYRNCDGMGSVYGASDNNFKNNLSIFAGPGFNPQGDSHTVNTDGSITAKKYLTVPASFGGPETWFFKIDNSPVFQINRRTIYNTNKCYAPSTIKVDWEGNPFEWEQNAVYDSKKNKITITQVGVFTPEPWRPTNTLPGPTHRAEYRTFSGVPTWTSPSKIGLFPRLNDGTYYIAGHSNNWHKFTVQNTNITVITNPTSINGNQSIPISSVVSTQEYIALLHKTK